MAERHGIWAWWLVCLALALPSVCLPPIDLQAPATSSATTWVQAWVFRPSAGWHQAPWTAWTTVWLHGSSVHLWRNLGGVALLAGLGWLARPPIRLSLLWLLAWPLTQLGMLAQASWPAYVGLSGVLHAGVALATTHLLTCDHPPLPRWWAALLLIGLAIKILMENPWTPAPTPTLDLGIPVASWAHLCGVAWGCGLGWLGRPRKAALFA